MAHGPPAPELAAVGARGDFAAAAVGGPLRAARGSPTEQRGNASSSSAIPGGVQLHAPGVGEARDLEKRFEADFAEHLTRNSQRRQLGLTALGASMAGAVGFVATPLLLPGLAVAAVAGGASGYHLAKRQSKDQLKRHVQAQQKRVVGGERPTLRRLKYLVKWGHWQLLEYEDASADLREAVLDEVVRAFSPWVQRAYLLRCFHGGSKSRSDGSPGAVTEVIQHLAPLCQLLQRRAAFKALEQAAEAVGVAALVGTLCTQHHDRCRIVFPTVLETISIFLRTDLPPEAEEAFGTVAGGRGNVSPASRRNVHLRRLRRLVASVQDVLDRPDVVQALSAWHGPTRAVAGPPGVQTERSAAGGELLEVPPEGVEHEPGITDASDNDGSSDAEFHSCSDDESSLSALPTLSRPACLGKASASSASAGSCFEERQARLPRGEQGNSWRVGDCASFDVRGPRYLEDRRKVASGSSLFELVNFDIFRIGASGPITKSTEHPDLYPMLQRARGDRRFFFIQNWIFPPYQVIIVGALDLQATWMVQETPHSRLWHRFLAMSNEERRNVFKVIMSIEDGPWLVKKAVPKKPVIVGRPLKMESHHTPGDHLEIIVDVSSGKTEQVATAMVMRALKSLKVSHASLLEATKTDELPEVLLVSVGMQQVDTSLISCRADR